MANVYTQSPRRACAKIELHPADIAHLILQDDIRDAFTDEEIDKMLFALGATLQNRHTDENGEPKC